MSREYSAEERDAALQLYQEVGLAEAWRATGIPKPTIASWARRAGLPHTDAAAVTKQATMAAAARADQLRAELRLRLLEQAHDALDRMDAPHVEFKNSAKEIREVVYPTAPPAAFQNYATSAAILIDKYRLEVGEATDRTERRDLSDKPDDELRDALREADRIASAGRAAPEAAGTPEG